MARAYRWVAGGCVFWLNSDGYTSGQSGGGCSLTRNIYDFCCFDRLALSQRDCGSAPSGIDGFDCVGCRDSRICRIVGTSDYD